MRNVFEAILECGHDEDFVPAETEDFVPTDAPAGSRAKIDVLAERIRRGVPLWHPQDRCDYSGLTGSLRGLSQLSMSHVSSEEDDELDEE